MAPETPQNPNINPFGCRWDPADPHSCFDDTSCGCCISPCKFFGSNAPDCEMDGSEVCCIEIKTC